MRDGSSHDEIKTSEALSQTKLSGGARGMELGRGAPGKQAATSYVQLVWHACCDTRLFFELT